VGGGLAQGFVRVVNHSDVAGEATVTATDDAGQRYAPLTLALGPRQALAFNTADLETGNPAKGLTGATDSGTGGWRLDIDSEELDVEALAYAHTAPRPRCAPTGCARSPGRWNGRAAPRSAGWSGLRAPTPSVPAR